MAPPKLSDDDRRLIAARVSGGETRSALAKEYDVAIGTIRKAIEKVQIGEASIQKKSNTSITEFRSRARKILWRLNTGAEKTQYDRWEALVRELRSKGDLTEPQAIVQASKSFDALKPLFATCDVSAIDPHPGSHADIIHYGQDADRPPIKCLDISISNRENLAWAIEAAGRFLGERIEPDECPNWAAYYLYNQARSDPNNFTGKYLGVVGKTDNEDGELVRKGEKRSIREIEEMLETLKQKPEGEEDGTQ